MDRWTFGWMDEWIDGWMVGGWADGGNMGENGRVDRLLLSPEF